MTTIYALSDASGVRYIGKTIKPLRRRLSSHVYEAAKGIINYRCNWLRSLSDVPSIKGLCIVDNSRAAAMERMAIALYRACGDRLVNCTDGGEGAVGHVKSADTCAKLSAAMTGRQGWWKGKTLSLETIQKLRASHIGKVHSVETRIKMSVAQKARKRPPHSIETRIKISEALRGKTHTAEARANMGASRRGKVRKPFAANHCVKISTAKMGKPWSIARRAAHDSRKILAS